MDRKIIELLIRSLSHEIKNPLTTIKGYVQLQQMKHNSRDDYYEKSLPVMISQIDRIERILDSLYPAFSYKKNDSEEFDLSVMLNEIQNELNSKRALNVKNDVAARTMLTSDSLLIYRLIFSVVSGFNWSISEKVSCTVSCTDAASKKTIVIEFSGVDFPAPAGLSEFMPYANKTYYTSGVDLYEALWISDIIGAEISFGGHMGIIKIIL